MTTLTKTSRVDFDRIEDDALFAQLAENLQREDLTLIELANAVFTMRSRGHTQATIATRLAKSQAWVSRILRLRENAAEALLRAVGDGEIPFCVALALSDKDERAQLRELERFRARVAQVGKQKARDELDASTGKTHRPPAKTVRLNLERLRSIERTQRNTHLLDLAERILAWSLGEADWPDDIPLPVDDTRIIFIDQRDAHDERLRVYLNDEPIHDNPPLPQQED